MVAPDDDLNARPQHRGGRAQSVFSLPAQSADDLLRERRASLGLRSLAACVFGIAFLWPALPDSALIKLFAAYTFIDGILALSVGGWGVSHRLGWPLLIGGCIGLAVSAVVYLSPAMTVAHLIDVTAVWSIASGFAFAAAYASLRDSDNDQFLLLSGIAALVFGRGLISQIPIDAIVLSAWLGFYALTISVLFLKLALKHSRLIFL